MSGVKGYTGAESPDGLPLFMDSVTFVVEQGWKGNPRDTVHAAIKLTGPDCPTRFTPTERYLAYVEQASTGYVIGVCTRTELLRADLAQADLRQLGPPRYSRP